MNMETHDNGFNLFSAALCFSHPPSYVTLQGVKRRFSCVNCSYSISVIAKPTTHHKISPDHVTSIHRISQSTLQRSQIYILGRASSKSCFCQTKKMGICDIFRCKKIRIIIVDEKRSHLSRSMWT